MTHDYRRDGASTLFAALVVESGWIIGDRVSRHRAKPFLKLLREIGKAVPAWRDVQRGFDNYATHKIEEVPGSLDEPPCFTLNAQPQPLICVKSSQKLKFLGSRGFLIQSELIS